MQHRARRIAGLVAAFLAVALCGLWGGAHAESPAGAEKAVAEQAVGGVQTIEAAPFFNVSKDALFGRHWRNERRERSVERLRPAAEPSQGDAELIEIQDFEDPLFPPELWQTYDVLAIRAGHPTTPDYTWSREICDVDLATGKLASAWSVGGGGKGQNLTCGAPYTEPVETRLTFENIDTRPYTAGLQVQMRIKLDLPRDQSFLICASRNDNDTLLQCTRPTQLTSNGIWVSFQNPLVFSLAGRLEDAQFVLIYVDANPTGQKKGVFVDNVRIEGLKNAPEPTATPSVRATNTERPGGTNTPRPSGTIVVPPTRPPLATPRGAGRINFLPAAYQGAPVDDRPPVKPASFTRVEFGTFVDDDSGKVDGKATLFPYGIMQLCGKSSWERLAPGSVMRWQWSSWNGQFWEDYNIPPLVGSINVNRDKGFVYQCVGAQDSQGNPAPIGVGKYRLAAFIGTSLTADNSAEAEIADSGTRAPTSVPTPQPTGGPSPTEEPTPDDPGNPLCTQRLSNGNFERGATGWTLSTNATQTELTRVIRQQPTVAFQGEWLAVLGGGENVQDVLGNTARIALIESSRIVSASLSYAVAVVTDQTNDGNNDDTLASFFVSQDAVNEQVPNSGISEEVVDHNAWYTFRSNVTRQMTQHEGWTSATIAFLSRNNGKDVSFHLVDDVELTVCLNGNAAGKASRAGIGSPATWSKSGRSALPLEFRQLAPAALVGQVDGLAPNCITVDLMQGQPPIQLGSVPTARLAFEPPHMSLEGLAPAAGVRLLRSGTSK